MPPLRPEDVFCRHVLSYRDPGDRLEILQTHRLILAVPSAAFDPALERVCATVAEERHRVASRVWGCRNRKGPLRRA